MEIHQRGNGILLVITAEYQHSTTTTKCQRVTGEICFQTERQMKCALFRYNATISSLCLKNTTIMKFIHISLSVA